MCARETPSGPERTALRLRTMRGQMDSPQQACSHFPICGAKEARATSRANLVFIPIAIGLLLCSCQCSLSQPLLKHQRSQASRRAIHRLVCAFHHSGRPFRAHLQCAACFLLPELKAAFWPTFEKLCMLGSLAKTR